ncbi:hypothetical protein TrVE_jg2950 [Triparma verrucosa]|uniref:Uncharacterized protein n=1 Tax=Triparma verrucosa TaxID=1606542 RepID=A0A9W7FKW9_9STRA|nr:hypothetical protein TrVE_jg2950 [Triparma verrucosa]
MRMSTGKAALIFVILSLIIFLNLRFVLEPEQTPNPSGSLTGSVVGKSDTETEWFSVLPSPEHASNSGSYISTLQKSILDKQRDIDRVNTENSKIQSALTSALSQSPGTIPFSPSSSSSKPSTPPPSFPALPGKYKIKSYIGYLKINPKNDFLSLGSGYDPLDSLIFTVEPAIGGPPNSLVIKHSSKPLYLSMRASHEPENWVVKPTCTSPSDPKCHFTYEPPDLYSTHAKGYVNLIQGEHIRGHAEEGSSYGAAPKSRTTRMVFEKVGEEEVKGAEEEKVKAKTIMKYMDTPKEKEYIERIKNLPKSEEKRVISFGLYGDNPKYTTGAIRNAELRDTYFPGWVCRFYVDGSVPAKVIEELKGLGSEIIVQEGLKGGVGGMFWRFLVADDPTVDRYIVRDSDSRLNARDRFAIEEWIESGKCVHNIRDHVNHVRTMNGGLWGGRKGCIEDLEGKAAKVPKDSYMQDIYFLEKIIWPLIQHDQMSHDAYSCNKFQNSRPFPTQRDENYQHVGQVFFDDDSPRMNDIDGFIRGKENPVLCRPKDHPDWKYG